MQKFNTLCKFSFNLNLPTSIKRTLFRKHLQLDFLDSVYRCKTESSRKSSTNSTYEIFVPNFLIMLSPSKQRHDKKKLSDAKNAIEYF